MINSPATAQQPTGIEEITSLYSGDTRIVDLQDFEIAKQHQRQLVAGGYRFVGGVCMHDTGDMTIENMVNDDDLQRIIFNSRNGEKPIVGPYFIGSTFFTSGIALWLRVRQ